MVIHDTERGQLVFVFTPKGPVKKVFLVGDFNDWDPTARRMARYPKDGTFRARVGVTPGRHEYKFVVDAEWVTDPEASETATNPYGTGNSVVVVPEPPCECECQCQCT